MAFMLLIHEPVGQRAARTRAEGEAVYARMLRFAEYLKAREMLLAVESLAAQDQGAARVERRGGHAQVLDGPFAEAKEMVGGFFLLNCKTRAEAVEIARACPAAEWATVEVRETAPCYL
ncbi:YciI family protein [Ramlibacter solisilvae]|uniref:Dehydrogenase n=1 Tax=Ramlibacter tataouinensis TaxID=94132 RepID=A0A127JY93_9BURK|nr:YciI family protein [Ramlibacter tataouinensis]AMO23062.1 dehydrogenase [Ramlibacter tataouinensis]